MNVEVKKITRSIYLVMTLLVVALLLLFWFYASAHIKIRLTPVDATIYIDDSLVANSGSGNIRKNVEPGLHTVRAEAENFVGFSQSVNFKRGFSKELVVTLTPMPTPVKVADGSLYLSKGTGFNDAYYLKNQALYHLRLTADSDGVIRLAENRQMTDFRLTGITEIVWSPLRDLALLRKDNGGINIFDFMKYDFIHQTESVWGQDIEGIAWAPDNSEIIYAYAPAGGEHSLVIANLTNSSIERVANLKENGIENPLLRWSPDSQQVLVIPRSNDGTKNILYLFDVAARSLKPLTENGYQLEAQFSPDSNKIIYNTYSKSAGSSVSSVLSIMDRDGQNQRSLDLRADISKISWSRDSRNITAVTINGSEETLVKFDTTADKQSGFVVSDKSVKGVSATILADDDKILIYETADGIYAVKVQ